MRPTPTAPGSDTGFSLVETLVALAILTLAIAGPLGVASQSVTYALNAKDQMAAVYLAQEAMEAVRNIRDSNRLDADQSAWLTGAAEDLAECAGIDCGVNIAVSGGVPSISIAPCTSWLSGDCTLYYHGASGLYNHDNSGAATSFVRTVRIGSPIGGNTDEASVVGTVTWRTRPHLPLRTVMVREHLFNW